jgi:crossover junction endodeoxyribonuclease RuvC
MRILGIDPGMRLTGYGCIDAAPQPASPTLIEAGVLKFNPKESMESRLAELHTSVVELIQQLQPDRVAVEKLFSHYNHPQTAIVMGHARGVILLAAEQAGLVVDHLPATEVKKSISGNGHASKLQIQQSIATLYRLAELPSPPDVADAIAIATTSARRVL